MLYSVESMIDDDAADDSYTRTGSFPMSFATGGDIPEVGRRALPPARLNDTESPEAQPRPKGPPTNFVCGEDGAGGTVYPPSSGRSDGGRRSPIDGRHLPSYPPISSTTGAQRGALPVRQLPSERRGECTEIQEDAWRGVQRRWLGECNEEQGDFRRSWGEEQTSGVRQRSPASVAAGQGVEGDSVQRRSRQHQEEITEERLGARSKVDRVGRDDQTDANTGLWFLSDAASMVQSTTPVHHAQPSYRGIPDLRSDNRQLENGAGGIISNTATRLSSQHLFDRIRMEKEQVVPRRSTLPFPHGQDQRVPNSHQQGDTANKESYVSTVSGQPTVVESMSTQAPVMSNLSLLAAAAEDQRRRASCPEGVRVAHSAQSYQPLSATPLVSKSSFLTSDFRKSLPTSDFRLPEVTSDFRLPGQTISRYLQYIQHRLWNQTGIVNCLTL